MGGGGGGKFCPTPPTKLNQKTPPRLGLIRFLLKLPFFSLLPTITVTMGLDNKNKNSNFDFYYSLILISEG